MRNNLLMAFLLTSALCSLSEMAVAQESDLSNDSDLLNMSLQQLVNMDVTSVSKRDEKASQAPAALYVITQEDIRRSGMQSVPELLRMVPGLQVAQAGSNEWAIASRGFDGQFSNKLLVLIDGRTVYSPVFSGVFWDVQNLILEDIDRIEVIRGPGATLWGANAVNGVINIITKNAKDTQGTLVSAATGTQERVSTSARYGGTSGNLAYRTYAQYFDYNQQHNLNGKGAGDAWDNGQGGFRMDWNGAGKDTGTLQGDVYQGKENAIRTLPVTSTVSPSRFQLVNDTDHVSGMNVLGRWKHEFSSTSDITLQAYYDDTVRELFDYAANGTSFHTQTTDFDFQHNWTPNKYNEVTWGLGYRRITSITGNDFYVSFQPENYYENLYSSFLQDKISIVQNKLFLTVGSKFEHNDFSGFEYEPSARITWLPSDTQTVWAAVSKAVHTPNQSNQDLSLVLAVPSGNTVVAEKGNPFADSEDVLSYELGYRVMPREDLSVDVTGYYNYYHDLASLSSGATSTRFDPFMGTYTYAPQVVGNANSGETHGVELASTWQATKNIKFNGSYTIYVSHLDIIGSSLVTRQGNAPNQQFSLRSYVDLPHNMQWDTMVYHVDQLPNVQSAAPTSVPAYTRLDMRLGWVPMSGVDLSLIGQNLLRSEHQEFTGFIYQAPIEVGRSVLAKATVRF
ncbi:MAG TPA: TonB-dependent receptor [Rickettsiales bacterium]|nr:TonB-dependent receptor [Rickettsiales bacterium]